MFTSKSGEGGDDIAASSHTADPVKTKTKKKKVTAADRKFIQRLAEIAEKSGQRKQREIASFKTDTVNYQCELVEARVDYIVNNYFEPAVNAVILAEREDGSLYTLNGQHTAAALARLGFKKADSIVLKGLTLEEEALAFIVLNDRRTHVAPSRGKTFKAKVTSGDKVAVALDTLLKKVGIKLSGRGPNGFASLPILEACYAYDKGVSLEKAFWDIKAAWPGIKIDGTMLHAITGIIFGCEGDYNPERLRSILMEMPPKAWTNIVAQAHGIQNSRYMPHFYAVEVLARYNHNIRKHNGPAIGSTLPLRSDVFTQLPAGHNTGK